MIAEQPGTIDGAPFVTLKVMNFSDFGPPRTVTDGNSIETISLPMLTEVDINCYGNNSEKLVNKMFVLLRGSYAKQLFKSKGFAIMKMLRPFNIGAAVGGGWESRFRLTLEVSHVHKVTIYQNFIDKVDIQLNTDKKGFGAIINVRLVTPASKLYKFSTVMMPRMLNHLFTRNKQNG